MERFERVLTADATVLSVDLLAAAMESALVCQSALDHAMVRLSAAADALAADPTEPTGPGGESMLRRSRLTNHCASKIARRAAVLDAFPNLALPLAEGEIRGEHLDALGGVLRDIAPDRVGEFTDPYLAEGLLGVARRSSPTELAREARTLARFLDEQAGETEAKRIHRQRRLRFVRHHDGTVSIHGNLGADGAEVRRMVEQEAGRLRAAEEEMAAEERSTDEQLNADALTSLLRGGATHGGVRAPVNPTCIVQLTLEDLIDLFRTHRTHATTSDGVPLSAEWVERLVPTAQIVPVLLDQSGLPIELARAARRRLATMTQRAVLSTMYDTCTVPGCDVPFDDCQIHHVVGVNGSNTVLGNLTPLCGHDHHEHHAGRRVIGLDTDRNVTVTLADGTVWAQEPYRPPDGDHAGSVSGVGGSRRGSSDRRLRGSRSDGRRRGRSVRLRRGPPRRRVPR